MNVSTAGGRPPSFGGAEDARLREAHDASQRHIVTTLSEAARPPAGATTVDHGTFARLREAHDRGRATLAKAIEHFLASAGERADLSEAAATPSRPDARTSEDDVRAAYGSYLVARARQDALAAGLEARSYLLRNPAPTALPALARLIPPQLELEVARAHFAGVYRPALRAYAATSRRAASEPAPASKA